MKNLDRKIVVFGHQVLTQRLMDELCMDELAKEFDVEYWNCNALCIPHVDLMTDSISRPWVYDVNDIDSLKKRLDNLPSETIAILKIFVNVDMYDIHKLIGPKVSCGILYYLNKGIWDCMLGTFEQKDDKNENPCHEIVIKRLINRIKNRLYKKKEIYLLSQFVKYRGGEQYVKIKNDLRIKEMMSYYPHVYYMGVSPSADFQTSHPDYDKILKLGKINENVQPYIVFIDAFYPYHADWKERNPSFDWDALGEPYYKSMRAFFDKVEKQYGCEVIVAAHPNANYDNNPFGKRKCIKFKTVELVKDSRAVILHSSNSINFIAYYNKPVCFVSNDAVKAGDFQYCLYQMASSLSSSLGFHLYDVDNLDSVENIFRPIDSNIRLKIINRYFGDTSKGLPNSKILRGHFKTIFAALDKKS